MPPSVRWLEPTDSVATDAALGLLQTEFPDFTRAQLDALVRGPGSRVAVAGVGPGSPVVGVAAAEPLSNDLRRFEVFGDEALLPLRGIRIGVLSSAVVEARSRQKGVGRALALALIDWLRSEDCEWLVATALKSGESSASQPGLERLGFVAVARVDGPTYREKNLGGGSCPTCSGPCRCEAVLMVVPLRSLRIY